MYLKYVKYHTNRRRVYLDFLESYKIKLEKGLIEPVENDEFDKFYRRIHRRMDYDEYLVESIEAIVMAGRDESAWTSSNA